MMMHKNKFINLLTLCILAHLGACSSNPNDKPIANNNKASTAYPTDTLKSYYYPLKDLEDGLVYEYAYSSNQQTAYYWFLKQVKDEAGNWSLVGTRYGANFETEALTRERVYPNGTAYELYQFVVLDTATGKDNIYPHNISQPTAFPFEIPAKQGQAYRFQSKFNLPPDLTMNYEFTRDRQFSKFLEFDYQQKKQAAVEFVGYDYLTLNDTTNGGFFKLDSADMKEIYVQNIGLVQIERKAPSGQNVTWTLKARYSMDSFLSKIPDKILPKQRMPQK
jgi:hypothetical protein